MKVIPKCFKTSWRCRRSDGELDNTLYEGLKIEFDDGTVLLLTKLSQGLRVLPVNAEHQYKFYESHEINFSIMESAFFEHIVIAYEADRQLQEEVPIFQFLMEQGD